MLKPAFVQGLKQTSVSADNEKVKVRVREAWSKLPKPKRDEILLYSGLKKTAVERAYKTGMVSAKIIVAMAQVLEIDPYYLSGQSDENRPFAEGTNYVADFLADHKYNVNAAAVEKDKKTASAKKAPPVKKAASVKKAPPAKKVKPAKKEKPAKEAPPASAPATSAYGLGDLTSVAAEISNLLDKEGLKRIAALTEDDIILMIRSLGVQSSISSYKRSRLELIKYLLLF